jgi:hypothetical protein
MNYKNDPVATNAELKRIQIYLQTKGIKVTPGTIIDVAVTVAKRLGAGDYTFYSELKWHRQQR